MRGKFFWQDKDIPILQKCIKSILYLTENEYKRILTLGTPDILRRYIANKTQTFTNVEIDEICNILTKVIKDENE